MYDPSLSYDENYSRGPFAHWMFPQQKFLSVRYLEPPRHRFLGLPVHLPFGIPAGPLLNSRYVAAAWESGVSVATYKTVRSRWWPSHPQPNILQISLPKAETDAAPVLRSSVPPSRVRAQALREDEFQRPGRAPELSISNSFGVPSKTPTEWQGDVGEALTIRCEHGTPQGHPHSDHLTAAERCGRVLVLSFQGSRGSPQATEADLIADALVCQKLALDAFQTQSHALQQEAILEVNLSCPNERGAPIYTNITSSLHLLETLRSARPSVGVKLIAKIGSLPDAQARAFVQGAQGLVDGIAAINTVPATILSDDGQTILGSGDTTGGVCGSLIFQENLEMVRRLVEARERANLSSETLAILSVGGITTVDRFHQVLAAGADHAQSATGCMWNQNLVLEIASSLGVRYECRESSNVDNFESFKTPPHPHVQE